MAFSLYVHFPFCQNKCSYCDFYKESFNISLEKKFYEALKIETALARQEMAENGQTDFDISTIFIGGGTPSLTNTDLFADWLRHLKKFFKVPRGIEFSIETNPESITSGKLQTFKKLGITRPTFGMQTFNDKMLKILETEIIDCTENVFPGHVVDITKQGFIINTSSKAILVKKIHLEASRAMDAASFVAGHKIEAGRSQG